MLLKVVSGYDLSGHKSMSVIGFQKTVWIGGLKYEWPKLFGDAF